MGFDPIGMGDMGEPFRPAEPAPKTDGPKNVAFFQGLNALREQMRGTLAAFEMMVKALTAEAFTRGFKAGYVAGKVDALEPAQREG